ncbi:PREDICTED: scarecrow-like protein 21 isoform X2 [Ipomoea nil]|uniref:scarecrow-like protein 21 isoform X2 n=1 Tax=Ipomoea nil TaxID=35883 RepID=UPI000900BC68|nr:PREDICTED: scarecrow-like protein 21 isoform X2 [Ipomoea nil]
MQPSQNNMNMDGSRRFYNQPVQDLDNQFLAVGGAEFFAQTNDQYHDVMSYGYPGHSYTADSFLSDTSGILQQDSQLYLADVHHHSPEETYHSAASKSSLTDENDLKHKLRELESAMFGHGSEAYGSNMGNPDQMSSEAEKLEEMMGITSRRGLKESLVACAKAIEDNDIPRAEWWMSELRTMVSVCGEPIQRLGAYMLEGMVARLASSGSSIYKALRCKEPTSNELFSYMYLLYEVCPFFKFGYLSANGAIVDAMKDEERVHIIDFQISQGTQWITLIHALAARPGGPPQICITGIDDSTSAHARGGGLEIVGKRLSTLAESCKVPFEFRPVAASCADVKIEHLNVRPGEALAVNFPLVLHHMPDEDVGTQNHRDRLVRMVRSLFPKVVTLVEQESDTNKVPFFPRFVETLNYYLAVFESIDVALPRDHKERINVEQHCLAREVVNILACEGEERVERHEVLEKWRSRFSMAGFTPYPLSSSVNATIKTLLENYCKDYTLEERDQALYLGWMNRALVASCAWQ